MVKWRICWVELLGRYSKTPRLPLKGSGPQRSKVGPARPLVHAARKRLSPEAVAQLGADYETGRSTTMLMRDYHLGKGTVLRILEEHGVTMRGQGIPDDHLDEVIELYKSGQSLMRISKQFGCSAETIRQELLGAGIQMRARWERGPQDAR